VKAARTAPTVDIVVVHKEESQWRRWLSLSFCVVS
jgi:hypothetical protein